MKRNLFAVFALAIGLAALLAAATLNGYLDISRISAPMNPASGGLRIYANNSTGKLACLDSSGADCMPSGGGGGGAAPVVDTFANVSGTACTAGQSGLTTDSIYMGLCDSTPSWRWLWGSLLVTPPASSGWTWINQGGSTAATSGGALLLTMAGSPGQWRQYMRTAPATPYTVYMRFSHADLTSLAATLNEGPGVCFGDGSGKFTVLAPLNQLTTNIGLLVENWTNFSTFSAGVTSVTGEMDYPAGRLAISNIQHFRLVDDGTNLSLSIAADGRTWVPMATVSRTSFFAAGPTTYGVCWRSTTAQGSYILLGDATEN